MKTLKCQSDNEDELEITVKGLAPDRVGIWGRSGGYATYVEVKLDELYAALCLESGLTFDCTGALFESGLYKHQETLQKFWDSRYPEPKKEDWIPCDFEFLKIGDTVRYNTYYAREYLRHVGKVETRITRQTLWGTEYSIHVHVTIRGGENCDVYQTQNLSDINLEVLVP